MLEFQEIPYELSEDCRMLRIKSNGSNIRIKKIKPFDNDSIKDCLTGLLQILNFPIGSIVYGITPRNILIHAGVPFEKGGIIFPDLFDTFGRRLEIRTNV